MAEMIDEEPGDDEGLGADEVSGAGHKPASNGERGASDSELAKEPLSEADEDWLEEDLDEEALDEDDDEDDDENEYRFWSEEEDDEYEDDEYEDDEYEDDDELGEELAKPEPDEDDDEDRDEDSGEEPSSRSRAKPPQRTFEEPAKRSLEYEEARILREMWKVIQEDPTMSGDLLRTLLRAAESAGGRPGEHAANALRELQGTERVLKFTCARNFPREAGVLTCLYEELFTEGYMSVAPVHWAWEGMMAAIAVEIGMTRPPLLPKRRLRQCVDALRCTAKPVRHVLLVTTERPPKKHMPKPSTKEWLGVLLWSQLEPELRELAFVREDVAQRWSQLLDEALELGGRHEAEGEGDEASRSKSSARA